MVLGTSWQRQASVVPQTIRLPQSPSLHAAKSAPATRAICSGRSRLAPSQRWHYFQHTSVPSRLGAVGSHEAEQVEDLLPEPLKSSPQRSAALHDFCMAIPYGLILLVSGAVSLLFGSGWSGGRTLVAGCFTLGLANVSLQSWKAGRNTMFITLLEAGIAAGVTAAKFQRVRMVQMPWVRWSNFALSGMSGLMFAFLCYNMLAGGNPSKPPEAPSEEGDLVSDTAPLPDAALP